MWCCVVQCGMIEVRIFVRAITCVRVHAGMTDE